jgi:hypothetical protein
MACVAVTATLDASGFPPHAAAPAALSLPATHPNGRSHAGHPVPTYSTVLLALCPHVVSVSVPPSGVADPRSSAYSSREPPKKARKPDAHVPDVYMPGMPSVAVDTRGAVPATPVSRRTSGSPRHTGGVGDGVAVRLAVGAPVRVPLGVRVGVPVGVRVGVPVALLEPVTVREPVAEPLADALRRLATLTPRYVRRASTASAGVPPVPPLPPPVPPPVPPVLPPPLPPLPPPPPPAASHSSTDSRSPLT